MRKNMIKGRIFKTVASFAVVSSVAFSACSPYATQAATQADSAEKDTELVKLTVDLFDPSGIAHFYSREKVGTKMRDSSIGKYIADPSLNRKFDGATFLGYYYSDSNKPVGLDDVIQKDTEIYQDYSLQTFTITAIEGDHQEKFTYDIGDSYDHANTMLGGPKYVPEGYEFVGWESDDAEITDNDDMGFGIPWEIAKDFTIRAKYKKIAPDVKKVSINLHMYTPDGLKSIIVSTNEGTKIGDVDGIGQYIKDPSSNRAYDGTAFKGIFYDSAGRKPVSAEDPVTADMQIYQVYDLTDLTITAYEGDYQEEFTYTITDSRNHPYNIIRAPSYVPAGYRFTGWTSSDVPVKEEYINGILCYVIPDKTAKNFAIKANYEKEATDADEKPQQKTTDSSPVIPSSSDTSLQPAQKNTEDPSKNNVSSKRTSSKKPSSKTVSSISLSSLKIYGISDKTYTGKNVTQRPYVYVSGRKMYLNIRYGNRKAIGKQYIILSGKTPVKGTVKKYYLIRPAKPNLKVKKTKGKVTLKVTSLKGGAKGMIAIRKRTSKKWRYYKASSKTLKLSKGMYEAKAVAYKGSLKSAYTKFKKIKV